VAERAVSSYDVPDPSTRLVAHAWNTTYRVDSGDGKRYLLRVHREPVTSVDQIGAELAWLDALSRDTDLLVPQVVRRRDGRAAAVETAAGASRVCVLFRWISGRFLEAGLRPAHLDQVGRLLARLHEHAAVVRGTLQRVRRARVELGDGPGEFGLIHGDLHQENFLFAGGRAAAIDFDDCGSSSSDRGAPAGAIVRVC
jgi:Ser/Thr protein kinase RdoA (MazF antagonist)